MFRHNFIVLAAALATSLTACYSAPTTSAGTVRYPTAATAAARPVDVSRLPSPAAPEPAPGSTNDPLYRLDMP